MTVSELNKYFEPVYICSEERAINDIYCCDLPSNALGKMKSGSVWITVIASVSIIAVALGADAAAVIFAEGNYPSKDVIAEAERNGVSIFVSDLPIYETALKITV